MSAKSVKTPDSVSKSGRFPTVERLTMTLVEPPQPIAGIANPHSPSATGQVRFVELEGVDRAKTDDDSATRSETGAATD
ncbi:MAG: hypothetical protein SF123_09335 [Chloroflexota bacterium]|nr:hypothetical protein [Chloroflexota bacterium]